MGSGRSVKWRYVSKWSFITQMLGYEDLAEKDPKNGRKY